MVEYNYDAWGNFVAEKVREVSIGSATVDLAELTHLRTVDTTKKKKSCLTCLGRTATISCA